RRAGGRRRGGRPPGPGGPAPGAPGAGGGGAPAPPAPAARAAQALPGHHGPVDIRTAPGALPPVLLLAAERDGATPYPGALGLQERLPGSSLVTENGAGTHGIAYGPNTCVNAHVEAYLLHGTVPGHRVYCAPRAEPKPGDGTRATGKARKGATSPR
ncbi:alpha/beta hydrolase, partial [Streptomyces sp. NPDC059080]|uniref:alpha/beta hydrolase n=1 Tax=Streptomyces sp. NPDC059080 TaxID=3346718 RepID=UPI00367C73C3